MEIGLGWLGIGLGFAGLLVTQVMTRTARAQEEGARSPSGIATAYPAAGLTLAITLVFWAIAMQKHAPFSPGQSLAWGFLIGGVAGAAAILLRHSLRTTPQALSANAIEPYGGAFLGILGLSATYLLFHGGPEDALLGFAIGIAMATIIGSRPFAATMESWAIFTITTAIAVVLAVNHFDNSSLRMWWPVPILVAATVAVAGLVAAQLALLTKLKERPGAFCAVSALIGSVLVIGLSSIYSWRIVGTWQLLECVTVGIVAAAIVAWLSASAARSNDEHAAQEAGVLSLLVIVAGAVVGFKLWAGLGIAVGLIGAWTVLLPAMAVSGVLPRILRGALLFGLGILLFRLFIEFYGPELGKTDVRVHYTFVGAVVGAITPLFTCFCLRRVGRGSALFGLAAVATIGLLAAALPLALLLIWQIKAVMGLMFGLVVGSGFVMLEALRDGETERPYTPALLAIGAQLVAIQFVWPLLEVELTRAVRVWVLVGAAVVAIVWLALSRAFSQTTTEA